MKFFQTQGLGLNWHAFLMVTNIAFFKINLLVSLSKKSVKKFPSYPDLHQQ